MAAATVKAVDTVGAGDAFVGALAAELARGRTLVEGCRFATAVATLTVTKPGHKPPTPVLTRWRAFVEENTHEEERTA